MPMWVIAVASLVVLWAATVHVSAEQKDPSISSAWISLPAEGAASTRAFVVIQNPTMYGFYVMKASSDAAGSVEMRQTAKDAAVDHFTVPAFGAFDMEAEGVHLLLKNLKMPLAAGNTVKLTMTTEDGVELSIAATVKKP
jgi:copper(I)-binding protein